MDKSAGDNFSHYHFRQITLLCARDPGADTLQPVTSFSVADYHYPGLDISTPFRSWGTAFDTLLAYKGLGAARGKCIHTCALSSL